MFDVKLLSDSHNKILDDITACRNKYDEVRNSLEDYYKERAELDKKYDFAKKTNQMEELDSEIGLLCRLNDFFIPLVLVTAYFDYIAYYKRYDKFNKTKGITKNEFNTITEKYGFTVEFFDEDFGAKIVDYDQYDLVKQSYVMKKFDKTEYNMITPSSDKCYAKITMKRDNTVSDVVKVIWELNEDMKDLADRIAKKGFQKGEKT